MTEKRDRVLIVIICAIVLLFVALIPAQAEYFDTPRGQFKEACWVTCLNGSEQMKQHQICQYVFETKTSIDEDLQFGATRNWIRTNAPKQYEILESKLGNLY